MSDLRIFRNAEFGEIRTATIDGEPWFVGKDVATALGYSNASKAVSVHVGEDDRILKVLEADSQNGNVVKTQTALINESGLYSLILGSKLDSAKRFKHWVTSEVLPSIRKTGSYNAPPKGKELLALAILEAQKVIEQQNEEIDRMRSKEIFADAVAASGDAILIGELAKIIKQNGREIGQNRLFDWMRRNGYLICRNGQDYNMPTQRSMELKLFRIKERTINNPDGSVKITRTVLVTGKGQQYFVNKFMNIGQMRMPNM